MSIYGHQARHDVVCDTKTPSTSEWVVTYVQGIGGRIFDLPANYQAAAAEAMRLAHPRSFNRRALLYALVSGEFVHSRHADLVDLDEEQTRVFNRRWEAASRSHELWRDRLIR